MCVDNHKADLECGSTLYVGYKDEIYSQTDGVTMGKPLGPALDNFFMTRMKNKIHLSIPLFFLQIAMFL